MNTDEQRSQQDIIYAEINAYHHGVREGLRRGARSEGGEQVVGDSSIPLRAALDVSRGQQEYELYTYGFTGLESLKSRVAS